MTMLQRSVVMALVICSMTPSALLTRRIACYRHVCGMLLMTMSPPLCSGSWTMACSLSSISSLTPADQPCLLPILSISSLPLAMADRRALMFVPVCSSSPSLADLIRPFPLASTRHTRGCNSGDLSCSSIRAFSSALSSGLLPASSLASRPQGDWEWYSSLASLGGMLPPLPAGRAGSTGVASLALTARGCELPLCEPSAPGVVFRHPLLCGSSLSFLRKGLPESLRIQCRSLQSSYVEPTVPR